MCGHAFAAHVRHCRGNEFDSARHPLRRKDERRRITVYKPQASQSSGHAIDLAFTPSSEAALDAHFKVSPKCADDMYCLTFAACSVIILLSNAIAHNTLQ